jgi:DNA topoisomerase IB
MRLRRVAADKLAWTRRRCGRGFTYLDADGRRLDVDDRTRCIALAIPPAWTEVRICEHANGHIQAVGTDDAGRRQYLYHPQWRERRDRTKHDHVLLVGRRLPAARRAVGRQLGLAGMPKERALAVAFRLLDLGLFRVGGERYAEDNGSFGLATLEKRHVRVDGETMHFDYPAKSGQRRTVTITDAAASRAVVELRRRRGGGPQLLAYRDGGRWHDVSSRDIADYVKQLLGDDVTTKDFRTWHATVVAAESLALSAAREPDLAASRRVRKVAEQVAEELGNTAAVARTSYIDPRVVERFEAGDTIDAPEGGAGRRSRRRSERAVLRLLSPARVSRGGQVAT